MTALMLMALAVSIGLGYKRKLISDFYDSVCLPDWLLWHGS